MTLNLTAAQRQHIYVISTVAAPLLVVYGIVDPSTVSMWVALAGAILGVGGTGLAATTIRRQRADGTLGD